MAKTPEVEFREAYVKAAVAHRGYKEGAGFGGRSNYTIFWDRIRKAGGPNFQGSPWCMGFSVAVVYEVTGVKLWEHMAYPFHTAFGSEWCRKHGLLKTSRPLAGDWPMINFPGGDRVDHTGVTIQSYSTRHVEGNTGPDNRGSQNNGDGVYVRTRPAEIIPWWVDTVGLLKVAGFDFARWAAGQDQTGKPAPGGKYLTVGPRLYRDAVLMLQRMLNRDRRKVRYWPMLVVDGDFGPLTRRALQAWSGLGARDVDGDLGPVSAAALAKRLGIVNTGAVGGNAVRGLIRHMNDQIRAGRL